MDKIFISVNPDLLEDHSCNTMINLFHIVDVYIKGDGNILCFSHGGRDQIWTFKNKDDCLNIFKQINRDYSFKIYNINST